MGSRYLTELANWCRAAGLVTHEVDGWQSRARSSGGYDGDRPWAVLWHHTASATSPENDASYMCYGSPDAPVANLLLDRDGGVWVMAGGATNTNGKGGPYSTSRGTVPKDSMNTYAVSIEAANNGVGEWWPQEQIDAYFVLSLMLTERLGLAPDDICEHQVWAPDRKIDPAVADAVQGPWQPGRATSSGTWSQADVIDELRRRAGAVPPGPDPLPPPTYVEGDEVLVVALDSNGTAWIGNGVKRFALTDPAVFDRYVLVWAGRFLNTSGKQVKGWPDVASVDDWVIQSLGQT
jgi:hypothetical protein